MDAEIRSIDINGTLAVVNIVSMSNELTQQIIRLLEDKMVRNNSVILLTRRQIELVLSEQEFGASGYVDDDTAQKIGFILGAKYVLHGELINSMKTYSLNIQIIETESARLIYSNTFEISDVELQTYKEKIAPKNSLKIYGGMRF
jgi:TolB-like protein